MCVSYRNLIDGLCKDVDIGKEKENLKEVFDKGFVSNVVTCISLIDGFCKTFHVQEATIVWHEMIDKGCVPNAVRYNILIHGLCEDGDIEREKENLKGNF